MAFLSTAMIQPLAQRWWGAAQEPGLSVLLDYITGSRLHQLSVEGCIFSVLLSSDLTSRHLKIYSSNSFGAGNNFLIFPDYKSAYQ